MVDSMERHDNETLKSIISNCIREGNTDMLGRAQRILEERGVGMEELFST